MYILYVHLHTLITIAIKTNLILQIATNYAYELDTVVSNL